MVDKIIGFYEILWMPDALKRDDEPYLAVYPSVQSVQNGRSGQFSRLADQMCYAPKVPVESLPSPTTSNNNIVVLATQPLYV